ncbi:hypothetical protein SASPL_130433 [Salvia splendens]|uniref:Uncharacterized protein n=1 Tax=Salvia splendens TaxID=180675 RepID=A0A8X8ZJN0_SALSN|nr:hypothetical protein SASPL_130433 [Salvia splendens]
MAFLGGLENNFWKDRATGSNAEDVMEQVNALYSQQNLENTDTIPVEDFGLNDLFTEEGASESLGTNASADSVTAGERATPLSKRSNKKRKGDDGLDRMYTLLHKMHEDANSQLQLLSTRIGYEVDLSQARKDVFDRLGDIPGLSMDDVCEMLAKELDRLDIFMGLPEIARYAYVMRVLQEKRGN